MLRSSLALPDLRLAAPPADITFDFASHSLDADAGALIRLFTVGNEDWLTVGKTSEGYSFNFPGLASFVVDTQQHILGYAEPATQPHTLRHLLIDQVVPLHLASVGHAVLHASAVGIETLAGYRAIVFMGPSGAGKSSTAIGCALGGAVLLADDFAVLAPDRRAPAIWPADVGVRLWDDVGDVLDPLSTRFPVAQYTGKKRLVPPVQEDNDRPLPVPVGAVILLGQRLPQGAEPQLRTTPPAEAVIRILEQSHRVDLTSVHANRAALDSAAHIVESVPCFTLRLPESIDSIPASCSTALTLVGQRLYEASHRSALR